MQTIQIRLNDLHNPKKSLSEAIALNPQLVLVFGAVEFFKDKNCFHILRECFPKAELLGCSTAGEISAQGVADHTLVITAVHFNHPDFRLANTHITDIDDSLESGRRLGEQLKTKDLHNILVFSQGVNVNGSALIEGIKQAVGKGVAIAGGLAGDGGAFTRTYTLSAKGIDDRQIVGVGFYGSHLTLGHGSFGGWQPFGPARKITHAAGNVLYKLDDEPALDVYKRYLGEYAKDLPRSGLLFPFSMLTADHQDVGLIRTIAAIDNEKGALILKGDVIQGGYMKLMHASIDALVDGACAAAEAAHKGTIDSQKNLALLVSCVGRKLVMGARVDEEVEAVADVFGSNSTIAGFYSYGEISPFCATKECRLHNQTMTVTTLCEAA